MIFFRMMFLVCVMSAALGSPPTGHQLAIKNFDERFGAYLPAIEEVVGVSGKLSLNDNSDGLFLGISETRATDGYDWGYFINHLLVAEILFDPGTRIRTTARNPFLHDGDGYYEGITIQALRRRQSVSTACRVNDLAFAVVGTVNQKDEIIEIDQTFFDCRSGRDLEKFSDTFDLNDISSELNRLAEWIERSYNAHATKKTVRPKQYQFPPTEEIKLFASSVSNKSLDETFRILDGLVERFPEHSAFRADALWVHPYESSTAQKYQRIQNLMTDQSNQTLVVENLISVFDPGLDPVRVKTRENWLKRSLQYDQQNLELFLGMMDTKLRQDLYPEAMAVGLYTVKRWPGTYRSWASFSAVLSTIADECRTTPCRSLGADWEMNSTDLELYALSMVRFATSIHPAHPKIQAAEQSLTNERTSSAETYLSVKQTINRLVADLSSGNFGPYQKALTGFLLMALVIIVWLLNRQFQTFKFRAFLGKRLAEKGCEFEYVGMSSIFVPSIATTFKIKLRRRKPILQHDYGVIEGEWDDAVEEVAEMVFAADRADH